jgi:hypothetical protein
MFSFDPVTVWGLNETGIGNLMPDNLQKGLDVYRKVSKWMFVAYIIAIVTTAVELLVGISAIFSRIGSCITSLVSGVSALSFLSEKSSRSVLINMFAGIDPFHYCSLHHSDCPICRTRRHLQLCSQRIPSARHPGLSHARSHLDRRRLLDCQRSSLVIELVLLLRPVQKQAW